MEIEQPHRSDRPHRAARGEDLSSRTCYNDATIDERILRRVLDRIGIFEESIGALEPIIAQHQIALQETFDFTLSEAERDAKLNQVLTAIEAQRASCQRRPNIDPLASSEK